MKASQDHLTQIAELRAANQALEEEIRALRVSERALREAAAMTHVGHWEWNIPKDQIHWSDEVYRIYGIDPRTEMNYDALLAAIHPEDRDYHNERTAAWIEDRGGDPYEYRVVRPDGSIRHIYATGKVVCDEAGEPVGFMGTLQDMTRLKLAETSVLESETRFQATFEQAAVGFAHVALDGRFLRLNQKYCEIAGYSFDEMQQLTFQDITHPDDLEADLEHVRALLDGELATYSMEKRYIQKDGEVVWVNLTVSLLRNRKGEPDYFIAVVEDISDRKAMEQALSKSELRYRSIVEQTVEGILVVQGGKRKYYNPAWVQALGLSAEAYDATSFLSFVHPNDLEMVKALVEDFTLRGEFAPIPDFRIVTSSGDVKWISLRGATIEWEDEPAGALFIHDITRRKQAEIGLQISEARFRATFEQAAVGIAHVGLDGQFLRLNQKFCEIVGYTHHEMQSLTFQDITHPDDLEADLDYVRKLLVGQLATYSMEKRYIRKGGEIIWVNLTVSLLHTETDQPDFFISVVEDITERKRAAEELRVSEQRFFALFENAAIGIAMVDPQGRPMISNPALQRLLGYSDEELRGMAFREFTHPDDADVDVALFEELLANLRDYYQIEKRYLTKDGRTVWGRLTMSNVQDNESGEQFGIKMVEDITERKRAEEELRVSEQRFSALFENAAIGIALVDSQGHPIVSNPALQRFLGYSDEELRGMAFREFTHPDDVDTDVALFNELVANRRGYYQIEKRYLTKEGRTVWGRLTVSVVRDSEGEPQFVIGMAEDISERKRAVEELLVSEQRFSSLFENAAIGIALVDLHSGHPIVSNPALQRFLGYSDEELQGMAFPEFTHPDDVDIDVALFAELRANRRDSYQIEKRFLAKDGRTVWGRLTASAVRDTGSEEQFGIGMVEDITERKRIERALHESELKYRTVVEQATEGIIVAQDFERRYVNPAFVEMTGYPEDEYRAQPFLDTIHPDDVGVVNEIYQTLMSNSNADISSELRIITKSGDIRWLAIQGTSIEWEGRPAGMAFAKDITEQKYWEQQTQFYQRQLKALASQLTLTEEQERRRIAVELHDEVGQALAFSRVQIAAARNAKSNTQRNAMLDETTEILKETIQETRSLVFDLSSPLLHELGLNAAILEWMKERLEKRAGLKTELIEIGPEWQPSADLRAIIFRSIRELLTNVIRHARATHVTVTIEQTESEACIVVRDDGIGFEPEAITPGTSRSGGFGLFSIQERLSNLGGSCTIQSAPGEGTEVTLCLPNQVQ